jgi:hypothetical protein
MGQDASKPVEEGATEVYEKLFAAAKAKCAESDAKMWILIADGTGTRASSSLATAEHCSCWSFS